MSYKTEVFTYIANHKEEIARIANQSGVSEEVIAGAIAEEYNSILTADPLHSVGNIVGEYFANKNHQTIANDYAQISLPENRDTLLNPGVDDKFSHPTLNDIGYGNIKLFTAITLLNNTISNL